MAQVVCQVTHKPGRLSIVWSEGPMAFEPIHIQESDLDAFSSLARVARQTLADAIAGNGAAEGNLANLGRDLHSRFFAGPVGQEVLDWLRNLANQNALESLEIASDAPGQIPWAIFEDSQQPGPWGRRFALAVGHRANPLRSFPYLETPRVLIVLDSEVERQLSEGHRDQLNQWLPTAQAATIQSLGQLDDSVTENAPDILWILARLENGAWKLGAESLTPQRLQTIIAQAGSGNPLPIVVSTGVAGTDMTLSWECFLAAATGSLPGLVGLEVPTPASQAMDMGLSFLRKLFTEKLPIGQALRDVRNAAGPVGLAFAAFTPPNVRELSAGETGTAAGPLVRPLPDEPYHPLRPLEREDRALLFGRDDDIQTCALLLDQPNTCGLFIHGPSGVGKASLARAGLLPFLEEENLGFFALRDRTEIVAPDEELGQPTFALRTGPDLLGSLCQGLIGFTATPFVYKTPTGRTITVDLPGIVSRFVRLEPNASDASIQSLPAADAVQSIADTAPRSSAISITKPGDLWDRLQDDVGKLSLLLDNLTRELPFELLIPLEQVEDLIVAGGDDTARDDGVAVLRCLAKSPARFKVVATCRTEFLGQIHHLLGQDYLRGAWKDYHLGDIAPNALRESFLAPTSQEPLAFSDQTPAVKYGFGFNPDALESTLKILASRKPGGNYTGLQIAQALGGLLFATAKKSNNPNVQPADVKGLTAINIVPTFIREQIGLLPLAKVTRKSLEGLFEHLSQKSTGQVTRRLATSHELKSAWTDREPLEKVMNLAAERGPLIEIQQLMVDGKENLYLTVPQDSLATFGAEAAVEKSKQKFGRSKTIDALFVLVPLIFLAIAATIFTMRRWQTVAATTDPQGQQKIDPEKVKAILLTKENESRATRFATYSGILAQAEAAIGQGNTLRARQLLLTQQPSRDGGDIRGYEWFTLWRKINGEDMNLQGHRAGVRVVALSPDNKLLASGDDSGIIHLWSMSRKGELGAILKGLQGPALAIAFSPDGKWLAATDGGPKVTLWPTTVGETVPVEAEPKMTLAGSGKAALPVAFVGGSDVVAIGDADGKITLWNIGQQKAQATLGEHTSPIAALTTLPDGKTFVSADAEQVIHWDTAGKKLAAVKHKAQEVTSLASGPEGSILIGGTGRVGGQETGVVLSWTPGGKDAVAKPVLKQASTVLALAPLEGSLVVTGGKDQVIRVNDLKSGKEVGRLLGHIAWVRSLAVTSDGTKLASASYDPAIKLWNMKSALIPAAIKAHDAVTTLAFDPQDRVLASAGNDGFIRLWDPQTGMKRGEIKAAGPVACLAFRGADTPLWLAAGVGNDVQLWEVSFEKNDIKTKELPKLKKHSQPVTCLAFAADSATLATGSLDNTILLWDCPEGKNVREVKHFAPITALNISDRILVFGDATGLARFWDHTAGRPLLKPIRIHIGPMTAVQILNQKAIRGAVSCGMDQTVKLWAFNPTTEEFEVSRSYRTHNQPVTCLAQGKGFLATGGLDQTVKVWDYSLPDERYTDSTPTAPVRALALSTNNQILVSGGDDGFLRFQRGLPRPQFGPANPMMAADPQDGDH